MSAMNSNVVPLDRLRVACSNCNLRELCLPLGMSRGEIEQLDHLVALRRKVPRGEALFRAGDEFTSLYAVRLGFLKSVVLSSEGREQVTGFHMAGELVGMDGIGSVITSSPTSPTRSRWRGSAPSTSTCARSPTARLSPRPTSPWSGRCATGWRPSAPTTA